jgi:transposase
VKRERNLQESREERQRRLRRNYVNAVSSLIRHKLTVELIKNSDPVSIENLADQELQENPQQERQQAQPAEQRRAASQKYVSTRFYPFS